MQQQAELESLWRLPVIQLPYIYTNTPVSIISVCPVLVCREEVHEHMNQAAQHSQRAAELEGLLATVKTKVQDLEDRCLGKAVQQLSHTQQLQQENLEVQVGKLGISHSAIL